jgi:hypothetical protein
MVYVDAAPRARHPVRRPAIAYVPVTDIPPINI